MLVEEQRELLSPEEGDVEQFKGFVNDEHDLIARLTINDNNFWGYHFTENSGDQIFYESAYEFLRSRGVEDLNTDYKDILLIYKLDDLDEESSGECQLDSDIPLIESKKGAVASNPICTPKVLKIATYGDNEFYQNYGTPGGFNRALSILNHTEGLYSTTFNMTFKVVKLVSQSTLPQPCTNEFAGYRLDEMRNFWKMNIDNTPEVVKLFFTGLNKLKRDDNGVIKQDVVGRALTTSLAVCGWSDYSFAILSNSADPKIPAHEIGHLFGALHPWLIPGNTDCNNSQNGIMCYNAHNLFFGPASLNTIGTNITNHGSCLNRSVPSGNSSDWVKTWTNDFNPRWIGSWYINIQNQIGAADFDGDGEDELLTISTHNDNKWAMLQDFSCSSNFDWEFKWANYGNSSINTWNLGPWQEHYTGDFNGDGKAELLSVSFSSPTSHYWAMLQSFDNVTKKWNYLWSNMGSGKIDTWNLNQFDVFVVGDFDGDSKDELYIVSENVAQVINFDNNVFGNPIILPGSTNHNHKNTAFYSGNFTNSGKDELLVFKGTYATLFELNQNVPHWNSVWSNNGSGSVIDLNLPVSQYKVVTGEFDQDGKDEVIIIQQRASSFDFNGGSISKNWTNFNNGKLNDWNTNSGLYFSLNPTLQGNLHNIMAIEYSILGPPKAAMFRGQINGSKKRGNINFFKDSVKKGLSIYPNPARSTFTVNKPEGFEPGSKVDLIGISG